MHSGQVLEETQKTAETVTTAWKQRQRQRSAAARQLTEANILGAVNSAQRVSAGNDAVSTASLDGTYAESCEEGEYRGDVDCDGKQDNTLLWSPEERAEWQRRRRRLYTDATLAASSVEAAGPLLAHRSLQVLCRSVQLSHCQSSHINNGKIMMLTASPSYALTEPTQKKEAWLC